MATTLEQRALAVLRRVHEHMTATLEEGLRTVRRPADSPYNRRKTEAEVEREHHEAQGRKDTARLALLLLNDDAGVTAAYLPEARDLPVTRITTHGNRASYIDTAFDLLFGRGREDNEVFSAISTISHEMGVMSMSLTYYRREQGRWYVESAKLREAERITAAAQSLRIWLEAREMTDMDPVRDFFAAIDGRAK